jgi:glycosyltransferase 2 family protein
MQVFQGFLNVLCLSAGLVIIGPMAQTVKLPTNLRRYWLMVVILGLVLYALLPQIGDFRHSWELLGHVRLAFVWLAIGAAGLTYAIAAVTYCLLAFKPLVYGRTWLMQLAAMFINRLLPAGVGALGVGYIYLRHNRHTSPQAATVVTVNNLLGLIGHGLLVAVVVLCFRHASTPAHFHLGRQLSGHLWLVGLGVILLLGLLAIRQRRWLSRGLATVKLELRHYRRRPSRLAGALLTSMSLTLTNVICLWACLQAFNLSQPLAVVLIIFTVGLSVGNVTPTPGGLGGVEAGLVGALIAYRVPSATALGAVLLYRLITYWLALAIGALAFVYCRQRGYLSLA